MSSKSLFSRASGLFPGGVNSPVRFYEPYPRFIRSGDGPRITDEDGREYIDYCLAFGPMILGHANHEVVEAIKLQASSGISFGTPSKSEVELAEAIREAVPSMEMMRFTNSGTEATMHAIRLARHFTGRSLILKVEGGFHGSHDYALITAPYSTFKDPKKQATIEVPFNNSEALRSVFSQFGKEIAAFIVEPALGNIGVVEPDKEFLQEARKLTTEYGALLIFDEVITGFRFHNGAYQDMLGIRPDLTTLGKIIGGGLPVGLFGGREDIMRNVAPSGKLYQQGTFSGNPVTMAAGLATLRVLQKSDYSVPVDYVRELSGGIDSALREVGVQASVNSIGTMFTVFFNQGTVSDNASALRSNTARFTKFFNELLDRGVFIQKSQFEACFVSFAHTREDISQTLDIIREISSDL